MAKAKKVVIEDIYQKPPDNKYWFYVGDKYYRRLQPIPYSYKHPDIKNLKNFFNKV
jgi:hypothetical protein